MTKYRSAAKPIDRRELKPYLKAGMTLIPLHKWNDRDPSGKDMGKAPRDRNWTKREYQSEQVVERCVELGWNIGVRLEDTWHVVDVDPKNGGREGFQRLCSDLGLKSERWPKTTTGSGGAHYYLRTPDGIRLSNSPGDAYPGVEIKGPGRQVVAAGSWHPNGKQYYWDEFDGRLELHDAPDMPDAVLDVARKPERTSEDTVGGEFSAEELEQALQGLDPAEFRDAGKWEKLMFSCHHATGGDGREVFAAWSRSDEGYDGNNDDIESRWDSADPNHSDPVTVSFLNKCLRDAGNGHLQLRRSSAQDDFSDSIDFLPDEGEEWPRQLRYNPKKNSRQNAAVFLGSRPERLISSDGTIYSLNKKTKLWSALTDAQLAVEIAATDSRNVLGHLNIKGIAESIHLDRHTSARPFTWINAPKKAPAPDNTILFRNGLLDLATKQLRKHTGNYFATGLPDFDYDPAAQCPLWMEKIGEWLHESYHATLQEFMGYALTPDIRYESFLLMLGAPRGGKGTIMSVMQKLVGPKHHTSRTLNDLGNDFGLDGVVDKRLLFIPDAHDVGPGKHTTALERIKAITGRDELSINRKNRDIVTARIPAKLVMAANRLPKFIDESGALAARQLILRFENSWRGKEDRDLRAKLEAELPGIANWALEGLRRLRAQGGKFTIGEKGRLAAMEAAEAQSPALRFSNYALTVTGDPDDYLSLGKAFDAYKHWALEVEQLAPREVRGRNDFKEDLLAALMGRGVRYHRARKWCNPNTGKTTSRRGLFGLRLRDR